MNRSCLWQWSVIMDAAAGSGTVWRCRIDRRAGPAAAREEDSRVVADAVVAGILSVGVGVSRTETENWTVPGLERSARRGG